MKTKLNDFLTEGRSQPIDPQKIHSLKVSRGYDKPKVFRGYDYDWNKELHYTLRIDPTDLKPRESAHSRFNHYTLWIDNDKAWSSFPKRSRSIICTTSRDKASNYGNVYAVYPEEEYTTFGICPAPDIWNAFDCSVHPEYTTRWRDGELFKTPKAFAEYIKVIAPDYSAKRNAAWICNMLHEMGVEDDNYKNLISTAKAMGMLEWIKFVFDPVGFKTVKYENIEPFDDNGQKFTEKGNEVWTSWPCLLEANFKEI